MLNLTRKSLTPDQMKRANITASTTVTLTYLICLFITLTSDKTVIEKIVFTCVYLLLYICNAIYVRKHIYEKKAELSIAYGFLAVFGIISFIQPARTMMIIFPALLSLSVYMNEYLIIWGTGATFFFVITKIIYINTTNPADKTEQVKVIFLVITCLIVYVLGGCKAIKRLVEFSEEETNAVKEKAEKQLEIAKHVNEISNNVNTQFEQVRKDLDKIAEIISNTNKTIDIISDGTTSSAEQSILQSEKTTEIQTRLNKTNQSTDIAVNTARQLQQIVEKGKNESDELASQSAIVDTSALQISETIGNLVEHVSKVSDITNVIMNISSQTNLLALNASIEAARAGEAGKGFAVVADQIRSLSSGTQDSSNSIMEALSHLEATSDEMLESITETVELIQLNIEKVSTVNKSVSDITSDATSLGDNIKVVDSAVKQVENSNETLTANMNQVGEIMQIMTESINNAEQTTKTMLSKYEASARSATDIESVVGELMEELGIGGFMNVSDIKSGMKFRMVIEGQTNAREEYTGEVVDRKDNNVYININNRATFDDKRRNLKCSFNAVVDNVLYCWNDIAIHNVKAGEKGQFKLTIDTNPQVYNRRKYPRMPLDNKCTISVDGTDITYYGHMVNISANGFAFSVNDSSFETMKGQNIVIEIDNFDVIKDKEIQGCIIRCSNDEGNYIVGCRMPEDSNEIKDYVNKNYSE